MCRVPYSMTTMERLRNLELALAAAVSASLGCSKADRPAFLQRHVQCQLNGLELPTTELLPDDKQRAVSELQAELPELADWLTSVVNAARDGGLTLEAVAHALSDSDGLPAAVANFNESGGLAPTTSDEGEQSATSVGYAAKRDAIAAALKIIETAPISAEVTAPVTALKINRSCESRWGDRELELMARSLERPAFDPQLLSILAAKQRFDDAAMIEQVKGLEKHLRVMGVAIDQFGLWRQGAKGPDARVGVMGSVLFVDKPEDVSSLELGAFEIRGGAALATLLELLPRLVVLRLPWCQFIASLPVEIGRLVPTLRELDLSCCSRLPSLPEAIGDLGLLVALDLSGCEGLNELPSAVGKLHSLERLYISQSERDAEAAAKAAKEDEEQGPNRRRAARVEIAGAGITSLPDELASCTRLRHITLGLPGLTSVPEGLAALPQLQTLCLSGSASLAALPVALGQNASLLHLELPSCPATTHLADATLSGLSALHTLDLYGCASLASLPQSVGSLAPSLQALYLGSLDLPCLPDEICLLANLRHLDLRLLSLSSLPEALGDLSALTSFYLAHASVTALPESIGRLANLGALRISKCALLATLPDSLTQLTSLVYLELNELPSLAKLPKGMGALPALAAFDFPDCEELADILYDDPLVDELEANGCGVFGPGIEIETPKYVAAKAEVARSEEERKDRLATLRAAPPSS